VAANLLHAADEAEPPRTFHADPAVQPVSTLGRRHAPDLSPEIAKALEAGKLEQTCPACGRWEAAHWYCSWCSRPTGPADWYRNGDREERASRMPKAAPADPPSELLDLRTWPARWGPIPRQKPARQARTPVKRAIAEPADDTATPPSLPGAAGSVAPAAQLELNLIPTTKMAAASTEMTAAAVPEERHDLATPTA
jgi:hypothetical protein